MRLKGLLHLKGLGGYSFKKKKKQRKRGEKSSSFERFYEIVGQTPFKNGRSKVRIALRVSRRYLVSLWVETTPVSSMRVIIKMILAVASRFGFPIVPP